MHHATCHCNFCTLADSYDLAPGTVVLFGNSAPCQCGGPGMDSGCRESGLPHDFSETDVCEKCGMYIGYVNTDDTNEPSLESLRDPSLRIQRASEER